MNGPKKYILLCVIAIFSLALTSCNQQVTVKNLQVNSDFYQQTGHLLGNSQVELEVELEKQLNQDLTYYWKASGGKFLTQGERKVTYSTPKYPGNYNLKLVIKQGNQVLTTFNYPFTVKGDYPQQVKLKRVTSNSLESGVKLNWSRYQEEDFYGYKILRSDNYYVDDKAEVVANINQEQQNYYVDQEIEPDQTYTYQIMVTNNRGYLSASNEQTVQVLPQGIDRIPVEGNLSDIMLAPERAKGYLTVKNRQQLLVLDIKQGKISNSWGLELVPEKMVLDSKAGYLYLLGVKGDNLVRINLDSGSQRKYDFDSQIKDLAVSQEDVYLLTTGEKNLLQFDSEQGEIKHRFSIRQEFKLVKGQQIKILANRYLLVDKIFGAAFIYDLTDLTKPLTSLELGTLADSELITGANKHQLLIADKSKQVIKSYLIDQDQQLREQKEIVVDSYPQNLTIEEKTNSLFVTYDSQEVTVFSLQDYKLQTKIKVDNYVYDLAIDRSQPKLYLITGDITQTDNNLTVIDLRGEDYY
ncbi:YncE family protein [Halanaerobaculum tunisiense]